VIWDSSSCQDEGTVLPCHPAADKRGFGKLRPQSNRPELELAVWMNEGARVPGSEPVEISQSRAKYKAQQERPEAIMCDAIQARRYCKGYKKHLYPLG
jgi:hypothetical protein